MILLIMMILMIMMILLIMIRHRQIGKRSFETNAPRGAPDEFHAFTFLKLPSRFHTILYQHWARYEQDGSYPDQKEAADEGTTFQYVDVFERC